MPDTVFGPELPPAMAAERAVAATIRPFTDFHHRFDDPIQESDYPDDGIWRPSKGFFKEAPDYSPYSQGGSPFRACTRRLNGRYQMGCQVDPQYLADTGMTVDEAVDMMFKDVTDSLGLPPGTGPKDLGTGAMSEIIQHNTTPEAYQKMIDGDDSGAGAAQFMANLMSKGPKREARIEAWKEQLRTLPLKDGYHNMGRMAMRELKKKEDTFEPQEQPHFPWRPSFTR